MADNQHSQWPTLAFFKQQRPDIPLNGRIELGGNFIVSAGPAHEVKQFAPVHRQKVVRGGELTTLG